LIEDDFISDVVYVEVVLPLPLKKLFTYRVPSEYLELAVVGKRVFVPFGVRKVYTAIIKSITTVAPQQYEALNIISIIDDNPLISEEQMAFWEWMSGYYMCGLGDIMLAALPSGLRLASETFVCIQDDLDYNPEELDEREVQILKVLEGKEKIKISDLETTLKSKTSFVKVIKSLYDRGYLVIFEDLGQKYKPKTEKLLKINKALSEAELMALMNEFEQKASKKSQFDVLLCLIGSHERQALKTKLITTYQLKSSAIKQLISKQVIDEEQIAVDRFQYGNHLSTNNAYQLTPKQAEAIDAIETEFETKSTVLLYGATASGKSLLYVELIKKQLEKGNSVLVLVPELALTHQFIKLLEGFFGDTLMVSHSRYSFNEKVEIWQHVQSGKAKVLLGARSALFMPIHQLGLIIVDEEHENTYKQSEKSPRYQARDCAVVLANKLNAKVLLGSATPSVETYYNTQVGKYGLVKLDERYGNSLSATMTIVDVKEDIRKKTMSGIFTETLYTQLKSLKSEHKQAILFQNRKGFVPIVECTTCGWVSKCINCDISLTYYKYSNNLRCHYCGFQHENIVKCQACGNHTLTMEGYGTERITEELQQLLPELNVVRFDQDSTSNKHAFKTIINDFENQKIDVLVGTQIVVKGFDFKNVSLTSVVNADQLLNFPDFRSNERTFQLLIQLAGRAGRHGEKGEMIIQTKQPNHPVLKSVEHYNYLEMYHQQISEREQFNYPPFSKLIKITFKHKSNQLVNEAAIKYTELLKQQLGNRVLGPETPHVSKLRNMYIRHLLIKFGTNPQEGVNIKKYVLEVYDYLLKRENYKALVFIADVDCN
jgi:primosomal protein N' (replication factor Y)